MILSKQCPICNKKADEVSTNLLPELLLRIINLKCGHSYTEKLQAKKNWEELETHFGKKARLYPYQGEGYEFLLSANFRAVLADEPGLGKTFQALAALILHQEQLCPALVVVKATLKRQWMKEIIRLGGPDFQPQIIEGSNDRPSSLFPIVIVTYDILNRIAKKQIDIAEKAEAAIRKKLGLDIWTDLPEDEQAKIPTIESPFKSFGFKTVILDECQQIKNPNSKRAQQVKEICKDIPHVIAASGSPIENHAGEYFTVLNIMKPERFKTYKSYLENYCDTYERGPYTKIGGIKDLAYFKEMTKDFIIRRKQKDVLPDLPNLNRKFIDCDFSSKKTENEYADMAEEFADYYNEHDGNMANEGILARMAKLRHLVGISKVPFCSEFVTDFINDVEPTRKLVIFVHHIDVALTLQTRLQASFSEMRKTGSQINDPINLVDTTGHVRDKLLERFEREDNSRIMIASTLASGEGLNLQFCSDCIILEREWNPKKEEQAERRFIRPEGVKVTFVNANYILTAGTIDEYLTELIEIKRANTDQTLDGIEYEFHEASLLKELAETLARKGSKKWRL